MVLAYYVRLVSKTANYFYRRFFCKINPSLCKTGVYHRVLLSNHVPNNIVIRISIWGRLTFGCIFVSACTCLYAVFIAWQKEYMQVIRIEEKCLEDEVGLQPAGRLVYWMGEMREIKMDRSIFNFSRQNIEQAECKAGNTYITLYFTLPLCWSFFNITFVFVQTMQNSHRRAARDETRDTGNSTYATGQGSVVLAHWKKRCGKTTVVLIWNLQ